MGSYVSPVFAAVKLAAVFLAVQPAAAYLVIESTFDTDLDGWTKAPGSDSGTTLTWVSEGGNPGGFLRVNEAAQGNTDRIAAPPKFLGDRSGFVGGVFSFDVGTNILSNPIASSENVVFIGGGLTLRYDLPMPTINTWTNFAIDLQADSGWILASANRAPTPAEFQQVLGDLTAIHLLADFRSGAEQPYFDNIQMVAIPEPGTGAVLALGALAAGLLRLRQRRA
jgi:hypothetical protein